MKPQKVLHLHIEEEKRNPDINHEYIVTEKYDGIYAYIDYDYKSNTWSGVHSREEREIPSLSHASEYFNQFEYIPKYNFRLIMEATIPGLDFHTTSGIFNRSVGDCQATGVIFKVHDLIIMDANGYPSTHSAIDRLEELKKLMRYNMSDHIKLVKPLAITNDKLEWIKLFNDIISRNGEGVILKRGDSIYQPDKRNATLMKIKKDATFDLKCVEVYHTKGKKGKDNLNITLVDKSGISVKVRIGKHRDIELIDADNSIIVDKVVEIKCMCKTKDGSYREPRFVGIRHDKNINDID